MAIKIEDLLQEFPEAKVVETSDHTEYYVHCRRHHKKGGKYKMSINAETGVYYCHDCKATGNVISEFLDVTNQFAIYRVDRSDQERIQIEKKEYNKKEWKDGIPSPGDLMDLSDLSSDHPAIRYLTERKVDQELANKFGVCYCRAGQYKFFNGAGTTSGRLIFPIYMRNTLEGWQARIIETKTKRGRRATWKGEDCGWTYPILGSDGNWSDVGVPKYYTCPGMKRNKALFNFDKAISEGRDFVVVVEGPIDAIKVKDHCVATLGSQITQQQIRILKSNWNKIILILDNDVDTESKNFQKIIAELSDGVDFSYFKLEGGLDPGGMETKEIWEEIEKHCSI
jgi:DNA primase